MFDRIGSKIKGFASIITWLGIIASCVSGFTLISSGEEMRIIGIVVMVIGSLVSWISSFLLYGFGELIEKTCIIEERLSLHPQMQSTQDVHNSELHELLRKGIISEEEYKRDVMQEKIKEGRTGLLFYVGIVGVLVFFIIAFIFG